MSNAYNTAYDEFNGKYHVNLNLYNEYVNGKILDEIDDFAIGVDVRTQEINAYLSTLSSAFSRYFYNKIKIADNKKYDTSDISLGDFIIDFDKLMKGIRTREAEEKNAPAYKHEPFAGLSLDQLASQAWNRISGSLNKPLHKIWAAQIRKGSLSIETMRDVTARAHNFLQRLNRESYTVDSKKDLANVVLARDAMKQAIKSRSIFSYLNPANWGPYRRERRYYNELKEQVKGYENNQLPVTAAIEDYNDNILDTVYSETLEYVRTYETTNQADAPLKEAIIMNSDTYEQLRSEEIDNDNISLNSSIDSSDEEDLHDENEIVNNNADHNEIENSNNANAPEENDNVEKEINVDENNEKEQPQEEEQKLDEQVKEAENSAIEPEPETVNEEKQEEISTEGDQPETDELEKEEKSEEEQPQEEEINKSSYEDKHQEASLNGEMEKAVKSQIVDILKVNADVGEHRLPEKADAIFAAIIGSSHGTCEAMDKEDDDAARDDIMRDFARDLFESTYMQVRNAHVYDDENMAHRVIAAQNITNLILCTYTPVKFDADKYGKYADNYALNNREALMGALENLGEECTESDEAFDKFMEELNTAMDKTKSVDPEKEPMTLEEFENPEEATELSPRVDDPALSQSVLNI